MGGPCVPVPHYPRGLRGEAEGQEGRMEAVLRDGAESFQSHLSAPGLLRP